MPVGHADPTPNEVPVERWKRSIPGEAWPVGIRDDGSLTRSDIFRLAERWHADDLTDHQFLVSVLIWGYGSVGYGPSRAVKILAQDPDGKRLETNLGPLRGTICSENALTDVYRLFAPASHTRLKGLGAAFFTKLLYFAAYRHGVGGVQPLILDRIVASWLPPEAGGAGRRQGGWPVEQWLAYLRWAAREANGGEPDRVEVDLFRRGRHAA